MVALDTSLSLSAPGQFARAQQLAKEAISAAPSGHLRGRADVCRRCAVVAAPSGDRALATAAVDAARPGLGSTRYRGGAVSRRRGAWRTRRHDRRGDRPAGERLGCRRSVSMSAGGARRRSPTSGAPPPNLAITAARAGRRTDRGDDSQRRAAAARRAGATVDRWRAGRRSRGIDRRRATGRRGAAGGARSRRRRSRSTTPTAFHADNVRYLVLDEATRPSVLVVTGSGDLGRDAFYVQQALTAAGEQGDGVSGRGRRRARSSPRGMRRASRPMPRSSCCRPAESISAAANCWRHTSRDGGGVLLAAGPDVDAEVAAGARWRRRRADADTAGRRSQGRPTRAAWRPPTCAIRSSARLVPMRQRSVWSGLPASPRSAAPTARPWRDSRRANRRCSIVAQGEGRALVFASDLDTRWNDFPRARDLCAVPARGAALSVRHRGRARRPTWSAMRLPGSPADAGDRLDAAASRAAPARRIASMSMPVSPIRRGSRRRSFSPP